MFINKHLLLQSALSNSILSKKRQISPNLYYLSYMLATGHWETTYAKEFDSLVERNNGREYDPVLASTDDKKGSKEKR